MDLVRLTSHKLLFFFISLLALQLAIALVPSTYVDHDCTLGTYDAYDENSLSIGSLLSDLIYHSSNSTFYSSKSGTGENTTYGFFYCTAGVASQDCLSCVGSAANDSQSYCGSYRAAVVFYRECTLRYSNTPVYGSSDESIYYSDYSSNAVSYKQFNKTLYSTLDAVITQAANGHSSEGFATGGAKLVGTKERLYTFAQCTPDILGSGCENCLRVALDQYQTCCSVSSYGPERAYLRIFMINCQLGHEVRKPSSKGIIPSSLSSSSSSESESESESTSSSSSSSSSPLGLKIWYIFVAVAVTAVVLH